MKCIPRSLYTAVLPRLTPVGDSYLNFPFFTQFPTEVEFHLIDTELLYIYRNPAKVLSDLVKQAIRGTGLSDLDYNFAIAQNVEGAYTIRGRATKCQNTEAIKVLMLVGNNEAQTDQLKENATNFSLEKLVPNPPLTPLIPGENNIHVFDLIEYLSYLNLYEGRNDGIYGPFVERAVSKLQLNLDLPSLTGIWDQSIVHKLKEADREYIILDS